ncbi:hypothetical protein ABC195_02870 [Microbacterium sp. 2P01SA-2]|uniref:hypothetical protein n=1 Tax=unclassified Microbacterium TaxID=2609290 RepID=UPI0039A10243
MTDPAAVGADRTDDAEDTEMDTTEMDTTEMDTTRMEHLTTDDSGVRAAEAEPGSAAAPLDRPRVRWAGIVWGVAFAAVAAAGLVLVGSPNAYRALVEWVASPSVPALVATALLIVGSLILVAGIAGMLRRGQRRRAAARSASAADRDTADIAVTAERHTA